MGQDNEDAMDGVEPGTHLLSELASDVFLDSIGFHANVVHRVLICTSCKTSIIPSRIATHIKTHSIHQKKIDAKISEVVSKYNIFITQDFPLPPPFQLAVEGLTVYSGYKCSLCNYCCLSLSTAEKHVHTEGETNLKCTFTPCKAQAYFDKPYAVRYFAVTPPSNPSLSFDLYHQFVEQIIPSIPEVSLGVPQTTRDIPPLLAKTEWHIFLKDIVLDPKKRRELKSLFRPSSPSEPWTTKLSKAVDEYMLTIRKIGRTVPYFILRRIKQETEYANLFFIFSIFY